MNERQSAARAHRRAMRKAGVEVAVREVVAENMSVHTAVSRAMVRLEMEGADMTSRIAITIGNDHPNFPGKTIVEAKAAASIKAPGAAFDYAADAATNERDDAGQ